MSTRMMRANITADEWAALRKLAIDRGTTTAELVAAALRSSPVTRRAFQRQEASTDAKG